MKAKNQQHNTSEFDAKEKLIVYVYEYLVHSGAKQAADLFKDNIGYTKDIKINEGPGFLLDWWCVFWDLYCAAPERRQLQPESSSDARAFHDLNLRQSTPMSPSMAQTSPPQQHLASQQPPPPQFITGHRYGVPPRGPPPRMSGPPPGHPPGHPPPGFMPSGSPRYAQHPNGPPPPQPHQMNQVPMGFNPEQMSHSPGLNRMTPVSGGPPQQQQQIIGQQPHNVGPPQPNQMVGMQVQQQPQQQMGGPPPQMQGPGGPQRNGSQVNGGPNSAWQQGNVNYNVNSPYNVGPGSNQPPQGGAGEPMMMNDGSMMDVKSSPGVVVNNGGGGEPSTPHSQDEYVIPVSFGQDTNDQCEEIMKIKQNIQDDTTKLYEEKQSDFNLGDYSDNSKQWQPQL